MNKSKFVVGLIGLMMAAAAVLALPTVVAAAGGPPESRGTGVAAGTFDAANPLDSEEQAILVEFLLDEHKALATYESIMADFGAIAPFASIARAEQQHIAALERVFTRYNVALPEIPSFDVPIFASPEAAAAAGAQAEIDNAALYDRLLDEINNVDVVRVTTNLRDASLNNHLPAFEAFADGTYVAGEGLDARRMAGTVTRGAAGRGARGLGAAAGPMDGSCLEN